MSLKKFKKPDKNVHKLTPKKLVGHQQINNYCNYVDGWGDYYDWWGYYYSDYYEDGCDEDFAVPVYGEWISKRNGLSNKEKRLIGQYMPEEVWIGVEGRREKRIDGLLSDNYVDNKNLLGDFLVNKKL
jgi:hypothetical protein